MLPTCFYKRRNKTKQNENEKKEKSVTRQESNPRPSASKGNALSIAPRDHCYYHMSNYLYLTFLCPRDKLFKMAQKMQTYDEMSTTKGHP